MVADYSLKCIKQLNIGNVRPKLADIIGVKDKSITKRVVSKCFFVS